MWLACIDQIAGLKDGPNGAGFKVIFLNTMAFWILMVTWPHFILDLMPGVHLDQFQDLLVCLVFKKCNTVFVSTSGISQRF